MTEPGSSLDTRTAFRGSVRAGTLLSDWGWRTSTIAHANTITTAVRIAVARLESMSFVPTFASTAVNYSPYSCCSQ